MQHENTVDRNYYINSYRQIVTKLEICPLKIIISVSCHKRSYSPFNQFQCIQPRSYSPFNQFQCIQPRSYSPFNQFQCIQPRSYSPFNQFQCIQPRSYSPFNQFQCIQPRSCLKLSESSNFLIILRNSSCASGSVSFSLELLDISVSNHQPVGKEWQSEGKKFWECYMEQQKVQIIQRGQTSLIATPPTFLFFQKKRSCRYKRG